MQYSAVQQQHVSSGRCAATEADGAANTKVLLHMLLMLPSDAITPLAVVQVTLGCALNICYCQALLKATLD
jgi:hypothetical protein